MSSSCLVSDSFYFCGREGFVKISLPPSLPGFPGVAWPGALPVPSTPLELTERVPLLFGAWCAQQHATTVKMLKRPSCGGVPPDISRESRLRLMLEAERLGIPLSEDSVVTAIRTTINPTSFTTTCQPTANAESKKPGITDMKGDDKVKPKKSSSSKKDTVEKQDGTSKKAKKEKKAGKKVKKNSKDRLKGKVKDPKEKCTDGKKGVSSVQGGEEVSEMKKNIVDVTKDKRTSFSLHDLPSDAPSDDPENDDLEDVSPSEPEGATLQFSPPLEEVQQCQTTRETIDRLLQKRRDDEVEKQRKRRETYWRMEQLRGERKATLVAEREHWANTVKDDATLSTIKESPAN